MKAIIKVVGTHALINGGFAAAATVLYDLYKISQAFKNGELK